MYNHHFRRTTPGILQCRRCLRTVPNTPAGRREALTAGRNCQTPEQAQEEQRQIQIKALLDRTLGICASQDIKLEEALYQLADQERIFLQTQFAGDLLPALQERWMLRSGGQNRNTVLACLAAIGGLGVP